MRRGQNVVFLNKMNYRRHTTYAGTGISGRIHQIQAAFLPERFSTFCHPGIQSTTDRREYHLRPTQKYIDYYNISYSYLSTVIERVRKRFPEEDVDKLEQMLTIISDELMPELDLMNKTRQRLSE